MRNVLLVSWLLLPVGAWAYHEGPGQDLIAYEDADVVLRDAREAVANGDYYEAVRCYEKALATLPKTASEHKPMLRHRIRLELNKARMQASGLPDARIELEDLVAQLQEDENADPELLADARRSLANAQFYKTWLMRLEGLDRVAWEPEIEAARQNWRLLAENAKSKEASEAHVKDLEAAVRLARMKIDDLQGLPLPSE